MKWIAGLLVAAALSVAPLAQAQSNGNANGSGKSGDRFEIGAFADYFRLNSSPSVGYFGVGGRLGAGVGRHVNLEADMAYDFERNVTSTLSGVNSANISATFTQSNGLRLWHGLFGPMFWRGTKHARVFGEVKGGFVNFSLSGTNPTSGFTSATGNFFSSQTDAAFYPGGGVEFSVGPVGLRLDVGDFMYFGNSTVNNLSVKFGPTIHF
jgi:hypothetical protein